jgi:peptidyl-prolyl cis-trans isomerase C
VYYQANRDKFKTFPLVAARHILLKAAPDDFNARDEMRELAVQIIDQLQQDPSRFSELAQQYSACPSKEMGGELGQISKGQTVPEFETQLQRNGQGLVTFPIETRYGIHIVWIDQKIEGKQLTFDMVKERIENYLNEKVRRKAIAQYIAQRINEADIEGIDLGVDERQTMQ